MNCYKKEKDGFTLLEMVIVVIVLAIVVILTLQALFSNVANITQKAKLNAMHSLLSKAITTYQAENLCVGNLAYCPHFSDNVDTEGTYKSIFYKIFKLQKNCGLEKGLGCFSKTEYKTDSGSQFLDIDNDDTYYKVVLQNGIAFAFRVSPSLCKNDVCANFIIDLNNDVSPNVLFDDVYIGDFSSRLITIKTSF